MTTSLGHIEIFCRDTAASAAFYRDHLGMSIADVQAETFYWMQAGSILLLLRPASSDRPAIPSYSDSRVAFVLYCDDIPALLGKLAEADVLLRDDADGPGCSAVQDPDGNWIQLVDPTTHR